MNSLWLSDELYYVLTHSSAKLLVAGYQRMNSVADTRSDCAQLLVRGALCSADTALGCTTRQLPNPIYAKLRDCLTRRCVDALHLGIYRKPKGVVSSHLAVLSQKIEFLATPMVQCFVPPESHYQALQ